MRTKLLLIACTIALCAPAAAAPGAEAAAGESASAATPFRVLVFSRTTGFRHYSIPFGVAMVQQLGREHGFGVDATEAPGAFNAANLERYAAVVFLNTTGTVLNGTQKIAFEEYIRDGGGYVGIHSAADTEHEWPFYGELVGAYFNSHPLQQLAFFDNEAPEHPATAHVPARFPTFDEFYSFDHNPRADVRVLLTIDEDTYLADPNTTNLPTEPNFLEGETGYMGDHPMSWCHDNVGGRAFYTALGHEGYLYVKPWFRRHVLGGILTATKRVPADCAPRPG